MAEYFGPFWPEGYFGAGYWGDGATGGPVYLDAVAVVSGSGGLTLEDATSGQDEQRPAKPSGSGMRRRASWRRPILPRTPIYLDAGITLSAGGVVSAKAAATITGGAVLSAKATVNAAPESVPTYTADAAFWLLAA